jgi:hypothetical protein
MTDERWALSNFSRKPIAAPVAFAPLFVFFVFIMLGWNTRAERSQSSQQDGVAAVISTDGALVLAEPDMDATPIAQLAAGTKVRVSKKTTSGEMPFRKIRVGQRIGYIAEIDIYLGESLPSNSKSKKKGLEKSKSKNNKLAGKKETVDKTKDKPDENTKSRSKDDPFYFSKFVGFTFGMSEFKEGIVGVDASAWMPFYGLKITGPDVLLKGPVIDFDLLLHYGAPAYYEPLSATKPTGFIVLTDMLLHIPVIYRDSGDVFLGLGPMLMLSQFSVNNAGHDQSLSEVNLGYSLNLGAGYRVDHAALRLEGKYFSEKRTYRGLFASIQTQF